jgi:cell division cycle 20-like protein 1 (cofactor of APC complex)
MNRVGACSWNGNLIATGSRDRSILVRDIRAPENYQYKLLGHKQEVCGLKWSMHDEN